MEDVGNPFPFWNGHSSGDVQWFSGEIYEDTYSLTMNISSFRGQVGEAERHPEASQTRTFWRSLDTPRTHIGTEETRFQNSTTGSSFREGKTFNLNLHSIRVCSNHIPLQHHQSCEKNNMLLFQSHKTMRAPPFPSPKKTGPTFHLKILCKGTTRVSTLKSRLGWREISGVCHPRFRVGGLAQWISLGIHWLNGSPDPWMVF